MGVVRMYRCGYGCCCKEVLYIDVLIIIITYLYSTCISSFLAAVPNSLFIFKMFFHSFIIFQPIFSTD